MTASTNKSFLFLWITLAGVLSFNACNQLTCEENMPADKSLDSVNDQQVAMDGYDVTAFFTDKKAVKGDVTFSSDYQGVTYYFATLPAKNLFDANPKRYIPQFGGYCAVAASFNKLEHAQIDLFDLYEVKLYFARNEKAQKMWEKDKKGVKERAGQLWPCLVIDNGRDI